MKTNRTGRSKKAPRHVRLYYWMTDCAAYHDLNATDRSVLSDMMKRYDGTNNGRIPYSCRDAADELHIGKMTAWRSISRLQEHGFIVQMKRGAFSLKGRHATEWRLTEFNCDVTNSLPSKEFMRWQSGQKIHFTVPLQTTTVSPTIPTGTTHDTDTSKKTPDGICSDTVEAKYSVSRYHHRYTDKLPGGAGPAKACSPSPQPQPEPIAVHGGHNLGPPMDDLTIPEFLRRH